MKSSTENSWFANVRDNLKWASLSLAVIVILCVVWWIVTTGTGLVRPLFFPSPESVWATIKQMNTNIWDHSLATLIRVVSSWIIGSMIGIFIGLIMARSKFIYFTLFPVIEGLRPVPPVALIPLVIVWFGIGDSGKIFLSALACLMVMIVNTIVATKNVLPVYLQAAQSLGAKGWRLYRTIVLPAIVPEILSGFKIGIALAFGITVATEFMGAQFGIGYLIMQASRTLNTEVVIIGTFIIGIQAFVVERLLHYVTARITKWTEQVE